MKKVAIVIALVCLVSSTLSAQVRERTRITPALALARICVSEANWTCFQTGDGLAIHEVLLRGAARHHMSYVAYAASYSGRVVGSREPTTPRGRWIRELNEAGDAPPSWPRHTYSHRGDSVRVSPGPSWSRHREAWLSILAQARQVIADHTLDDVDEWTVCEGEVHDWGGSMDRARADRIGLIEVECGDTANDFYARPSLVRE